MNSTSDDTTRSAAPTTTSAPSTTLDTAVDRAFNTAAAGTATAPGGAGAGAGAARSGDIVVQSNGLADRFMRRLLRLPEGKTSTAAEARSAFQKSLLITATRCVVMYIVLPFVLPIVGVASGVGPLIGLVIGILAMVSIVYSIRRFWRADHSKRWHYTVFASVIIGFLIYLSIKDIIELAT